MPSANSSEETQQLASWNLRVIAALLGAALLGILPLLIKGNVAAHDLQFHVASWNEVAQQWRHGIAWPRWAAGANYGFGEPRFIFYPPVSWLLGGFLALWLPIRAVPGAFSFIAFFAAGAGMFTLARRYLSPRFALAAAVLYAVNPYHLMTVYWDFRVAEMLASAMFPVAILFAMRCAKNSTAIVGLAITVAAVWLMNAPAGVMLMYTLALLLLVIASLERSVSAFVRGAVGIGVGIGLAAFYIVPAAYEQSWVNIYGIFGSGLTPKENFLFSVATDPPHTYFNFLVSGIALEQGALFAFVVAIAWRAHLRKEWVAGIGAIGIAAALMMFRIASPLWSLPKMQFVQFPWRWMLVLNLALCLMAMLALTNARMKWLWAILIVAFLGYTERDVIRQATWGKRSVAEIYWSTSQEGYRGTKEYLPHEVHLPLTPYLLPKTPTAELKCEIPCSPDAIRLTRWAEEEKKIQVASATPASLILKLYDYPAWKVRMDGAETPHESSYSGQLKVDLPPGRHEVQVVFTRTLDRTFGIVISFVAAAVLAVLALLGERRRSESSDPPPSNRGAEPAISS